MSYGAEQLDQRLQAAVVHVAELLLDWGADETCGVGVEALHALLTDTGRAALASRLIEERVRYTFEQAKEILRLDDRHGHDPRHEPEVEGVEAEVGGGDARGSEAVGVPAVGEASAPGARPPTQ